MLFQMLKLAQKIFFWEKRDCFKSKVDLISSCSRYYVRILRCFFWYVDTHPYSRIVCKLHSFRSISCYNSNFLLLTYKSDFLSIHSTSSVARVLYGNGPLVISLHGFRHLQLSSEVAVAYLLICGSRLNIFRSLQLLPNYFYSPGRVKGNLRSIKNKLAVVNMLEARNLWNVLGMNRILIKFTYSCTNV